jgi:pyruvate/2-oxoglutarate/acetoin dehydrogenase E1 component
MEEEMIRDENVFIMGEEVARYNGAYKVGRTRNASSRGDARLTGRSPRACWTSSERTVLST